MSKIEKLIDKLLKGKGDDNFDFEDLKKILDHFGFKYRNKGSSHFVFSKQGIYERINIQKQKNKSQAKSYQVKQVREIINKYIKRDENKI